MVLYLSSAIIIGPYKCVSESEDHLSIQAFSMFKEAEIFRSFTTYTTYIEGKLITQKTASEELDYDPSEGQNWNWKDYE